MKSPIIEWFVQESVDSINPYSNYFAGTVKTNEFVDVRVHIWNNRFGLDTVKTASDCKVSLTFDSLEDALYLDLCSIKVNDITQQIKKISNKIYVDIPNLDGSSNNGSMSSNYKNYATLDLKIGPIKEGMKNNIKNIIMDIVFNETNS